MDTEMSALGGEMVSIPECFQKVCNQIDKSPIHVNLSLSFHLNPTAKILGRDYGVD